MEAKVQVKYVRCTPMKACRVVDAIRGKRAVETVNVLRFAPQATAVPMRKAFELATANARFKAGRDSERFDKNNLFIIEAFVGKGSTLKRSRSRAQGRVSRILKWTSHITVTVGDKSDAATKEGAR